MIAAGTRLGPYVIAAPIGSGGMGEVYKATDTRLDRTVAIKVLPEHVAADPELKQRFEREAKTLAALSHPHICPVFDVGSQNGIDFLVMEYLEGETLEQRLKKGALPFDQALQLGIQIADALAAAHRAGIIHRDLKPGNIMLTKSGAKLLDFGLAKAGAPAVAGSLSMLPTTPPNLTAQGAILGTFQYMAPEQLEGQEADARTDIFAFGAVLYEMVTGRKAFEAKSQASLIGAILKDSPAPPSSVRAETPLPLDRLVSTCLAKDPDERWQSVRDLIRELRWVAHAGTTDVRHSVGASGTHASWRRRLMPSVGALLVGVAVSGLVVWNVKPSPSPLPLPVTRAVITLPPGQRLAAASGQALLALSPDGNQLAYVATEGATQQIYLRALNGWEVRPLRGTEGAVNPFFSPDGQWVGFLANFQLKKISVNGGAALPLASVSQPRGAVWSRDGSIIFGQGVGIAMQVPDAGGTPHSVTRLDTGDTGHRWPDLLPNAQAMFFSASTTTNPRIAVRSMTTGEQRVVIPAGGFPRYAPTGHLLFMQGGTLMAAPFDPQRLAASGTAIPVVENILRAAPLGTAQYSISSSGSLAYVPGGPQADQHRLVWVSRNGTEQPVAAAPIRTYALPAPRLSPDGARLAVNADSQIWLHDMAREAFTRFTVEGDTNVYPLWTRDGQRIVFSSFTKGVEALNLFWRRADGGGAPERLTNSQDQQYPNSFSPNGQLLAFSQVSPNTSYDIWVLNLADRSARPFLQTPFLESASQFSPDGQWLAYISNESGRFEVYVQPYPGPGAKYQISTDGGAEPAWNPSGAELFYRNGDKMMVVDIATQPSFLPGKPRVLFEGRYIPTSGTVRFYDVTRDGQRFLMLRDSEQIAPIAHINVVLNWFEELKRLVPTK
jgi:eukaryotic-like serine/threonine-protein kinase